MTHATNLQHRNAVELRKGLLLFQHVVVQDGKDMADICALRVEFLETSHPTIPATDDHRNWLYLGFLELLSGADWPPATTAIPNHEGRWIIFATPASFERNM